MNATPVPAFERGVRLREEADGSAVLLVPEGVVRLNASAVAALRLLDGRRSIDDIVSALRESGYDAPEDHIAEDVRELFVRLRERRLVRW
ncbi:MAG: pyrroloquinoline quinone biosynthesis peptide chaperone PqqD [Candidatus Eremiobacteraeota bacterium]|nr:pyrroloquinoline quinone biosynthesis peptide chaperone PqqD [Candidatus Eremiobacteraeota bacterium]MBV9648040.1 pyrroloquinoline quinone biosynthesis peptide chaperone PqqD [Candidatus Eremiobacteraeota bacterium]